VSIMLTDEERDKLAKRLEKELELTIRPKKIRAIKINSSNHWQPPMTITVGETARNLEKDSPAEEVVAIFEAVTFLVCTRERGGDSGLPYFFLREDVRRVWEYD
jgi:hypothetical protein